MQDSISQFAPHGLAVPEQGQIVRVRNRLFVVTEVRLGMLPSRAGAPALHLVSLASVEDDALGEVVQVLWEKEPGTAVVERAELPEPIACDSPERLDAFLDAVRWGAASQADRALLQAPFRSGIRLQDYQLNPLMRAVQMPRVSLLIADDVGLGKTVEAGLIIQELFTRNRARTVLVVCPAGLIYHWRDQMREKFGLEFRIVNTETMRDLRRNRGLHVNPWAHFPRLITSIDFLKRERPMRWFQESVQGRPPFPRPFDILVVDEAHNVAPSGTGQYATDSLRTSAIRELVPHFEHHLFLTATPHNGFPESFSALLELLDNQRFARGVPPNRQQLDAVMVRRLKRDLRDEFGNPRFQSRVITPIEVSYNDAERNVHALLRAYAQSRRTNAQTREAQYASEFIHKLLKKRLLSSPEAFQLTLTVHRETLRRSPAERQRSDRAANIGILRRQIAETDEGFSDDEEAENVTGDAVASASRTQPPLTAEEAALLDQMIDWAESASERLDSKTVKLMEWLRHVIKPGNIWNDQRVILFTEYRATQKWLQRMLVAAGLGDKERLALIYGGMDDEDREAIKAAFQAAPGADNKLRILLATDAASEGIDLQAYCHRLVHIEIPWNPNRLEQRNGRIDRMGQKNAPEIFHFVPAGYQRAVDELARGQAMDELDGDLEFLGRVVEKLDRMREDLAGKVGNVIATQVEEVMTGARRRIDLQGLNAASEPARALLRLERELDARIQKQIQTFYDERHTMHLAPVNVQRVVEVALELGGQPPLQPAANRSGAFYLPPLRGNTWNMARVGLHHPFTGVERPIVFDDALVQDDSVVLAHLNHPLVLLAQRLLRAEVWSEQGKLNRVTARLVPDHLLSAPALAAYARLVIIGGERYRLHEELITAGGLLGFGDRPSFRRLNVGELAQALEGATDRQPGSRAFEALQRSWPALEAPLRTALEARMRDRLTTVTSQLAERSDKEQADIAVILNELAQAIRHQLKPVEQLSLPGFSETEREQYVRDMDALRNRLEHIPEEIVREQEALRVRYADLKPRLFPVAVTLLVPERLG